MPGDRVDSRPLGDGQGAGVGYQERPAAGMAAVELEQRPQHIPARGVARPELGRSHTRIIIRLRPKPQRSGRRGGRASLPTVIRLEVVRCRNHLGHRRSPADSIRPVRRASPLVGLRAAASDQPGGGPPWAGTVSALTSATITLAMPRVWWFALAGVAVLPVLVGRRWPRRR